jgi:hypothetical protein
MYPPLWPKRSSIGLEALFPEALSKNVPSNGLIMAMGLEAAAAAAALLRLKNKHKKVKIRQMTTYRQFSFITFQFTISLVGKHFILKSVK